MKRKLTALFITSFIVTSAAKADYGFDSDYTGEAFFASPLIKQETFKTNTIQPFYNGYETAPATENSHTTPPIKQLRIKLQERAWEKEQRKLEFAPTSNDTYEGEIETSKYAPKDEVEDFEDMHSDAVDSDTVAAEEEQKSKKKLFKKKENKVDENAENIILDCQNIDYDTNKYLIYATGDVNVTFVKQGVTVKSDIITFDRVNNTIKAEGNVKIIKNGKVTTGDYIFVDMNEENALIENPVTRMTNIEIKSEKGYVYGDRIVQEKGGLVVDDSFPINFHTGFRGPQMRTMLIPKNQTLTEDMNNGIIKLKAQDIKITQDGEHEILTIKKMKLFKGDKLIFKTPSATFYTNKKHDYVETSHWEVGSIRGIGTYVGPGFVAKLPKGSVIKLMPILNYKSGLGFGGVGRFSSGTNHTTVGYGTTMDKLLIFGKQRLDDNLFMQYAMNSYMDEWFLGRRRPKYGASLVYEKEYASPDFLYSGHTSSFRHRIEGGYFHNLDFDSKHEKINAGNIGTMRFRYMAEARQNIYQYKNAEELKAFSIDVTSQLSSAIYGTGDTQIIGRVGPYFHMQYKRWMQDIGYFFAVYDDNTPLPIYDAYRYGKQTLFLREYFRICRWLTISWFGGITLSDDSPNGKRFQENGFYFSLGPDDVKFNVGYDFIRENIRCTLELMMDAKGTKVEYDKFELVQKPEAKKTEKKKPQATKKTNPSLAPVKAPVLDRAVVEYVKVHEDVI